MIDASQPSGVVLVYPYFRDLDPVDKLFPPLGIAGLASQIRDLGLPVSIVDCTFMTVPDALNRIIALKPAIVGISIMVTMSANALMLLRSLRARLPATLFTAGGPLPTVNPAIFAGEFDLLSLGEGDLVFPRFCRDYITAGAKQGWVSGVDVTDYPGMYLVLDGEVRSSPPVHNPSAILDRLPLPDRSQFDHRRYQQAMEASGGMKQTSLIITRGCPFACDFCSKPVWGDVFRKPPLERVFQEIEEIMALGYDGLWIADDCFTLDTGYLARFCEEMIRRGSPIAWTCLSRVDRLTPDLVDLMKRAGCIRVYLGLESGSDETLRLMKKKVTVEQGVRAVHLFSQAGVGTAGFFMVGYPGETVESIEKTFALSLSLPLDEAWFTVPLPLPGTPLFERVADPRDWEDWEFSNQVKFVFPSAFDHQWLESRIRQTRETFDGRRVTPADD
ncbi:B12-binding domain-containing radical SAM protein [Methanosphaerula palustris]|uniref:Radical SAM domain protein n=1 Tax=Methanosphaerula palustris (strain ATCC BAA-1556 / DSM 19958 / E1-9c) TaxID=521011 RepID=B8GJ97_METPE|nr:radical SAM protein [Methanosphaerula palustris]ACL16938.1 Radical SAM domain protein [Methanosphaerula palustris E1-9c]